MPQPKYPNVVVHLVGEDGNAFNVMGLVARAMREAGVPNAEVARFMRESMSSNYDNVLLTALRWVDIR